MQTDQDKMTDSTGTDSTGDMLRESAARLFQSACDTATLRAADHGTWPAALWQAVEEAGLTKALLPEAAGGFGVSVPDALSLLRVAAAHAAPLPLAETMLAGWMLAQAGLNVPDGPLSIGPVRPGETARLSRDGDGWQIEGTLTRIPWGRNAAGLAVLAQCGTETWIALVPASAFSAEPGANTAKEPRDNIRLHGAVTQAARTTLSPDHLLMAGAVLRTQQIAGALTRLTEMTVQYAQDRVQFGRPIGKFQAVQQNLAVMAGQTAAAVAGADIAADAMESGFSLLPIAAGKARAGEAASIAAGIAHQVHGAIGFTFEHNLHFLTRRLWSWRDEFGKDASWNARIGQTIARTGAESLWETITAA